ncbi:MAG: phosphoribosylformylglycinamidine synthase subunit PurQ, partial [Tidjanibacter sp.]|nr:phosphoribosylformylglycinamidine synthase subunit PurQ [Tidjanibacter sp.]
VPPTLIAFGVAAVDSRVVISPEFKQSGSYIYLVRHTPLKNFMPDTEALRDNFETIRHKIFSGAISSAYAVGFGGVAEALAKMTFGNNIGAEVEMSEADLFNYNYGSIVIESARELDYPNFELLGRTTDKESLTVNGVEMAIEDLYQTNRQKFTAVYPDCSGVEGKVENATSGKNQSKWEGEAVENPIVYLPVFPGTNCDYDMARAFEREGAKITTSVFCNLSADDVERSTAKMAEMIDECHILAVSGGFSLGDEPDGSGKFIASVLQNEKVKAAVERLQARGGLILGICNGFQALVKSGLLPFGKIGSLTPDSPTLFHNDIHRHISQMVSTRVGSVASPWLEGFEIGELHSIAASHGEGKFVASAELAAQLRANGQIAFQYADAECNATMTSPANPNGSTEAIEGICSPDGRILGKMGHSERYAEGLMKNISGNKDQNLFRNAVNYFRKK